MVNELADRAERPIDFEQGSGSFTLKQFEEAAIAEPVEPVVQEADVKSEDQTESKDEFEDEIPF
jgi:hypothetical protein